MLLAIDTSGSFCSAVLFDRKRMLVRAQRSDDIGRGHAEHLMPMLEDLIREAGLSWADIHHIVSVTGPGSFTGVRVGIATAKGLALGLAVNCSGVSTFQAFAHQIRTDRPLAVLLDAKRSELWFQVFDENRNPICEPGAVKIDEAGHVISQIINMDNADLAGSGASMILSSTEPAIRNRVISHAGSPDIVAVAEFASVSPTLGASLKPLYIRAPDAKPQLLRANP